MDHSLNRGILEDYLSGQAIRYTPEINQNHWEWLWLDVREERRGKQRGHK